MYTCYPAPPLPLTGKNGQTCAPDGHLIGATQEMRSQYPAQHQAGPAAAHTTLPDLETKVQLLGKIIFLTAETAGAGAGCAAEAEQTKELGSGLMTSNTFIKQRKVSNFQFWPALLALRNTLWKLK